MCLCVWQVNEWVDVEVTSGMSGVEEGMSMAIVWFAMSIQALANF